MFRQQERDIPRRAGDIVIEPSVASLEARTGRRLGPRAVLALSAWFGLLAGLLEVLTKVVCAAVGRGGRLYQMSRHFVWLIPLTNLLVFLVLGVFLALLVWVWPRLGRWLSMRFLAALALLPSLLVAVPEVYASAWFVLAWGIAVWCGPLVDRRAFAFWRLVAYSVPVLAGAVLVLAGWVLGGDWIKQSREAARARPAPGSPNVLLVVLDTVRADHLSVYGYPRKTTPTLELLASEGLRFDAAYATSPWTLPSHAGLFTGRLPHELRAEWTAPLGERFPTLAGYLGSRGYATAGFVANTLYCGYDTGLSDGFTHYEDYNLIQMDAFLMAQLTQRALLGFFELSWWVNSHAPSRVMGVLEAFVRTHVFSGKRKDAATINRDFFAWLSTRSEPDRPFFAFLNYFDAHNSYFPPRPTDYRFGRRPTNPMDVAVLENWETIDKPSLDEHFKTLALDCYDDCVRYLDEQLYSLFSQLIRQGILDRTLVIVTADHGESFGEHDLFLHGDSVYRPEIHVPLLIMMPGMRRSKGVVSNTVSLRDLPATVVDMLGLEKESPFPGHSLAWTWDDSRAVGRAPEPAVSELGSANPIDANQGRSPARHGPLTALTTDEYSYIFCPGSEELYDRRNDPEQRENLAQDDAKRSVLEGFRARINTIARVPKIARKGQSNMRANRSRTVR